MKLKDNGKLINEVLCQMGRGYVSFQRGGSKYEQSLNKGNYFET